MKTILVTGGCGFIGSNFIHYMLQRYDYTIINVDALAYAGNLENLKDVENNPRLKFVHETIENSLAMNELVKKERISAILHFAAESHVDRSIMDCAPFIKTNVVGTHVLLDAARANSIERFIHISTDEVYGSLGTSGYFREDTPLSPNSPYSASKAASDLLVKSYIHTYAFPAIIVRCSNNYGPYQFPEKFIPLIISNALNDEPIPLYGDGLHIRDWIYVDDFCQAIDVVLHKGRLNEIYNVGGNSEKTNLEVVRAILTYLDKPYSLIKFVQDRPGHDRRYAMDASKINNELGWLATYNFEEGIQKTIDWYKSNTEWLKHIKSGAYRKYYNLMYGERLKSAHSYVTYE